jgi:hypothetical protein
MFLIEVLLRRECGPSSGASRSPEVELRGSFLLRLGLQEVCDVPPDLEPHFRPGGTPRDSPSRRDGVDEAQPPAASGRWLGQMFGIESRTGVLDAHPHREIFDRDGELHLVPGFTLRVANRVADQLAREERRRIQHLRRQTPSRNLSEEPAGGQRRLRMRRQTSRPDGQPMPLSRMLDVGVFPDGYPPRCAVETCDPVLGRDHFGRSSHRAARSVASVPAVQLFRGSLVDRTEAGPNRMFAGVPWEISPLLRGRHRLGSRFGTGGVGIRRVAGSVGAPVFDRGQGGRR